MRASIKKSITFEISSKLFENSSDGIVITDSNNLIIAANPSFLAISGYELNEILGKNPKMFASGKQSKQFYQAMWDSLITHSKWDGILIDRRKDGLEYEKHLMIEVIKDENNIITHFISIHTNETERKSIENKIHYLANYDTLTDLPNRTLLKNRLQKLVINSNKNDLEFSILFLGLDRFKLINNALGHSFGDELLKAVTKRIKKNIRDDDTLARIGGDEFIILLNNTSKENAEIVAKNIIEAIIIPFNIIGIDILSKISIGITTFPLDGRDSDALIKNADIAMHQAKDSGRNIFKCYNNRMNDKSNKLFLIEKDISLALKNKEFFLEFQPQVTLPSGLIYGVEALIRLNHPTKGIIPPFDFIDVAEDTGQIIQLGEWIIREACKTASHWHNIGINIVMSINISIKQLNHFSFLGIIKKALSDFNLPPEMIDLELTEGIMIGDTDYTIGILNELRAIGVQLSIDDFGTGFSSLNYLKCMPITQLKIDKSFVDDIETNKSDIAIVLSIIELGRKFDLKIIAEGVETQSQLNAIYQMNCNNIQGYYYGKPMSSENIVKCIQKNRQLQ